MTRREKKDLTRAILGTIITPVFFVSSLMSDGNITAYMLFSLFLLGATIFFWCEATKTNRYRRMAQKNKRPEPKSGAVPIKPYAGTAQQRQAARKVVQDTLNHLRQKPDYKEILSKNHVLGITESLRSDKSFAVRYVRSVNKLEAVAYLQEINPEAAEVLIQDLVSDMCAKHAK